MQHVCKICAEAIRTNNEAEATAAGSLAGYDEVCKQQL